MKKNKHIVNAERIAALIPLAKTLTDKQKMVKSWASEFKLACRVARASS